MQWYSLQSIIVNPDYMICEVTCYQVLLHVNKHFTTLPYINIITLDQSQMRDKLWLPSSPPFLLLSPSPYLYIPVLRPSLTLFQCSPFPSLLSSAVSFQTWPEVESYPKLIWCTANIKIAHFVARWITFCVNWNCPFC